MTTRKEGKRHYLHHEKDGVEDDEGHDEVLEGGGDDHPPQLVLEAVSLLWHVTLQWLSLRKEVFRTKKEFGIITNHVLGLGLTKY